MSTTVNIHEAKTHLSRLLEKVVNGGEVVIAENGKPLARLVPLAAQRPRTPGRFQGQIHGVESLLEPCEDSEAQAICTGHPNDPLNADTAIE